MAKLKQSPPKASDEPKGLSKDLPPIAAPGASLFDLSVELRYLIYGELIDPVFPTPRSYDDCDSDDPVIPTPRSALTGVNRQLRHEVHDWIARRKLTLELADGACGWVTPLDEPVLRRATHIEFDLSYLPPKPSDGLIDLLCRLWRDYCRLKQVSFIVLDHRDPANGRVRDMRFIDVPNTLPPESKELFCKWLLQPVMVVLAKHNIQPAQISLTWKQHDWPVESKGSLDYRYKDDRTVAALSGASATTIRSNLDKSWTPLVSAVRMGHRAIVDVLFDPAAIDLKSTTSGGRTLLMEAVKHGQIQIMATLLQGLDEGEMRNLLNLQDDQGETAFHHAAYRCHLGIVSYLLKSSADPNIRSSSGMTPLFCAINRRPGIHIAMVELLCQSEKVDKTTKDPGGRTVLHMAAHNVKAFKILFRYSAVKIDDADDKGETPLFHAARKAINPRATAELIDSYNASSDIKDGYGRTPLSHAAERDNRGAIHSLLKAGADCTLEDNEGKSPMSWAVTYARVEVIERFVEHIKNGNDALILASASNLDSWKKGRMQLAILQMRKASTNLEEDNLRRLLLQATRDEEYKIIRNILHFHNIEADVRDRDGRTPLSHAAELGHPGIIKLLMKRGADQNSKDKQGQSPVDYARKGDESRLEHPSENSPTFSASEYLSKDWFSELEEQDNYRAPAERKTGWKTQRNRYRVYNRGTRKFIVPY